MSRTLTDWRFARSFIGNNSAGSGEDNELDFDLAGDIALEIASVHGMVNIFDITENTTLVSPFAQNSLHLNSGTLETINQEAGEGDQFEIDSNIIFEQLVNYKVVIDAAATHAAIDVTETSLYIVYTKPVLLVTNPSHQVAVDADVTASGILRIEYRYVELSAAELGLAFARRKR